MGGSNKFFSDLKIIFRSELSKISSHPTIVGQFCQFVINKKDRDNRHISLYSFGLPVHKSNLRDARCLPRDLSICSQHCRDKHLPTFLSSTDRPDYFSCFKLTTQNLATYYSLDTRQGKVMDLKICVFYFDILDI